MRPIAAVIAVVLLASPAWADAPVSRADLEQALETYYGGEKTAAHIVLGLGLASVGGGAYLLTRHEDFARGLGWPLLTLGALEAFGGILYVQQVDDELSHQQAMLAQDPTVFRNQELAHIQGVTDRFVYYRAFELSLSLAGAGLLSYGLVSGKHAYTGFGTGLLGVGVPFLVIDTFNNRRAHWYADQLGGFQPSLGFALTPGGAGIALSGQF